MNELIQAWTRAGLAVAAYYEKAANPLLKAGFEERVPEIVTEKPKTRKKADPKVDVPLAGGPAVAQNGAPAVDPLMQGADAQTPPATNIGKPGGPAVDPNMTEAESTIKAQEANKALVKAFPVKQADGMPEGFHKAKVILAEYGVARTTDLVHAQRVGYIAKIDALIAARPA